MDQANARRIERLLKVGLVADSPYYAKDTPKLQQKAAALLRDPNANERDLQEFNQLFAEFARAEAPPPALVEYVTLDQMAAMIGRRKRTLERWKTRKVNPFPPPDVKGTGGKPDEWVYSKVRAWLESESNRKLPPRPYRLR
jgi:hypothetical protein